MKGVKYLIIKDLSEPLRIKMNHALINRLPNDSPKIDLISVDLAKREAGFQGEKNFRYHLNSVPQEDFRIFYDLRLNVGDTFFQIDALLLSQFFGIIFEVKNFYGTLTFDSKFNQLIRTVNHKEEGFPNPLIQAKKHQRLLDLWLKKNKLPPIPIECLVVISYSSTILRTTENSNINDKVIHAENITFKIEEIKNRYKELKLTSRMIKKMSDTLISQDTPLRPDILQIYNIPQEDLRKGVQCPQCKSYAMNRKYRRWHCPHCTFISKAAHRQALIDYNLLLSPTITNSQCREFLFLTNQKKHNFY